jgi:hypothetical protein
MGSSSSSNKTTSKCTKEELLDQMLAKYKINGLLAEDLKKEKYSINKYNHVTFIIKLIVDENLDECKLEDIKEKDVYVVKLLLILNARMLFILDERIYKKNNVALIRKEISDKISKKITGNCNYIDVKKINIRFIEKIVEHKTNIPMTQLLLILAGSTLVLDRYLPREVETEPSAPSSVE